MNKSLCLLLGLLFAPLAAAADDTPWWQFWRSKAAQEQTTESRSQPLKQAPNMLFSAEEKAVIRDYLRTRRSTEVMDQDDSQSGAGWNDKKGKGKDKQHKQKPVPPGLQKKVQRGGQLPPGWQKKVARGEVIDGELYSLSQDLPPGIARQLRGLEGTETRLVGDRVIRLMSATREILDVLNP